MFWHMVRCRPIVKLFVVRRKRFNRSPDDLPYLLCIGSKAGGPVVLGKFATRREAAKHLRAALDWLDTPRGQAAYTDTITYLRNRLQHKGDL